MEQLERKILPIVKAALKEDIGRGDITSRLLIPAKRKIKAVILAKEKGVVCGLDVVRIVFKAVDRNIRFHPATNDTKMVKANKVLVHLEGNARSILRAERVALNFLGRLSGIATKTRKFVQRVKPYQVKIMDTRKTAPGLRVLEKYAVRCGGGVNHRMGLADQILIKDNHLVAFSFQLSAISLQDMIRKIRKKKPKSLKIEVEVKNLKEFKQALKANPDIIMLDNFSIANIKKAAKMRYKIPKLEVSGGVNLNNVRQIAACGVEMISVGELTHSAEALDLTLNCE